MSVHPVHELPIKALDRPRRSLHSVRIWFGLAVLFVPSASDLWADPSPIAITLSPTTSPSTAQAAVTSVNVTGAGFPDGTIDPAQIAISLLPAKGSSGARVSFAPTAITTLSGSARRTRFTIPSSVLVGAPQAYLVSISGQTNSGVTFASVTSAAITVNPPAAITSITPSSAAPGQSLGVTISCQYTSFLQGSTVASFGPGIAISALTIVNPNTAVVQIAIGDGISGPQNITVQTGVQIATAVNGFSVTGASANQAPVVSAGLPQSISLPGRVVVGHDVNTLSSSVAGPNEDQFAVNLAQWLIGRPSSKVLAVESSPNDQTRNYAQSVKSALAAAGFAVSYVSDPATISALTLADLQPYDAVFVGETYPTQTLISSSALIQYVSGGGNVYMYGGVDDSPAQEAALLNPFLAPFALSFETKSYNGLSSVTITSAHPIFNNLLGKTLGAGNGQDILNSGTNVNASIVQFQDQHGVYAVVTPSPGLLYLKGSVSDDGLPSSATLTGIWSEVSGPAMVNFSTPTATFPDNSGKTYEVNTAVTFSQPGTYVFRLTANDTQLISTSDVTITVTQPSSGPGIISILPKFGQQGQQNLSVTITGQNTHWEQNNTTASFGLGTTVTSLTIGSATSATAVIDIDSAATVGSQTVRLTTGAEVSSLVNGFNISAAGISVPNVVGSTQAAATIGIRAAGLVLGTVTNASNNIVPTGIVISQSPVGGARANSGSTVDLVVSSGPVMVVSAASINLQLSQFILTAESSATFTAVAVDDNGNPVAVIPTCAIAPDTVSASGTVPTLSSETITTANDTRGVYTLTCNLVNPSLTASASLTVLPPTAATLTTTQQATFAAFSSTTTASASLLQQINNSLGNGNQAGVNAALAQLQSVLSAVDFDALDRSMAFAPEGGFPVDVSQLPNVGINSTAQDANVGTYLTNLISVLQSLTLFLETTPLAAMTPSQQGSYRQLQTNLSTLVAQLPSLNPSTYAVVKNVDQEDFLFADVLPQYYRALTQATTQFLTANGFTAAVRQHNRKGLSAQSVRTQLVAAGWHPENVQLWEIRSRGLRHGRGLGIAFQIGTVLEIELASKIQMRYINQLYGPYFSYLEKAAATLTLRGALQLWPGAGNLDGIISGASLSIFEFHSGGSVIEGDKLNAIPQNNQVYLIGPDQINGVPDAATYLKSLQIPKNSYDLFDEIQAFVDEFKKVKGLYNEANQPPDDTSDFCILGNSPPCTQLIYNTGFQSVYQPPSGPQFPAGVLIFVLNKPAHVWSLGVFDFEPTR